MRNVRIYFLRHKEELSAFSEELNIDVVSYMRLYRMRRFKFYSAREDSKIIGYVAYLLHPLPHYGTLSAEQDVLYIVPEKRRGSLGLKILKYSESLLKELGVKRILQHTKVKQDIGPLFQRLGYTPVEIIHMKEL